jgi:hypothetical protein
VTKPFDHVSSAVVDIGVAVTPISEEASSVRRSVRRWPAAPRGVADALGSALVLVRHHDLALAAAESLFPCDGYARTSMKAIATSI